MTTEDPLEMNPKMLAVFSKMILSGNNVESMENVLQQFLLFTNIKLLEKRLQFHLSLNNINLFIKALFKILLEDNPGSAEMAGLCLVNITACFSGLVQVMQYIYSDSDDNSDLQGVVSKMLRRVNQHEPKVANAVLKLLCNLSRNYNNTVQVYKGFIDPLKSFKTLMDLFAIHGTSVEHNYDYISYLISNLCQLQEVRLLIMENGFFEKLLSFLSHSSAQRRSGIIKAVKNCSFELEKHEWLLSEDLDLLARLLLPLAGPDTFDDEDNEKLPLDLQYLPETKEREADSKLRIELVEALTQLSAKRSSREVLRDRGTYLILRELHKWEPDIKAKLACENLVDILIKTEDEIGVDNLRDLKVPEDLFKKFEQMDKDYLN